MKVYIISIGTSSLYHVEANSEEEAISIAEQGGGELLAESHIYTEVSDNE